MKNNIKISRSPQSKIATVDFSHLPFGKFFSDHMFIVDYQEGEWVNPRIEPFGNFSLHPATMALHYGQSIFEGMKASKDLGGHPLLFRPEMHARRMNLSAERMCMPTIPEDLFLDGLHTLVGIDADWIPTSEGSAMYIRPVMMATDSFVGVRPSETYRFFIITSPVGPYYNKPVRLLAENHYVRAFKGGTGEAKAAGNYAGALLPSRIAQTKGFDQVLWLDGHEFTYVQEVGTMNIFFVLDGKVVTPATDGAILKGITRDSILHLLQDKGYTVEERPLSIHELIDAYKAGTFQECFGAGTAAVVTHVAEITYGDVHMILPPVDQRPVGEYCKDEINGMRSGRLEDPYGWVVPVKMPQLANV